MDQRRASFGVWLKASAVLLALILLPSPAHAGPLDEAYRDWKRTYLIDAGDQTLRVAFGKSGPRRAQTVSEGQGYGMLITVAMGSRRQFNALWRFAKAHPSTIDPRLMDWKVPESHAGNDSAFDGDADMAYALILAHQRWGAKRYLRDARAVISGLAESAVGPESRLPLLGDWVLRSGSGYTQWQFRSSDCMPANFAAFAAVADRRLWRQVTRACVGALSTQSAATGTGLVSDFLLTRPVVAPAPPHFIEAPTDGQYNYNAGRVPWRLALGGPKARAVAQQISQWARSTTGGDPLRLRAGYRLNGRPAPNSDYFTTFFAAPLAVAASTDPDQRAWERALVRAVDDRREDYYEDSVTLLCLLALQGILPKA